ncbi:MAG TPA: cupin domain-containing protein [Gammaproteobacteria bacterium]
MRDDVKLLGTFDAESFLRDYWQKKPLLIRQALPAFESPIDADELAGLACEDNVESRLIEKRGDSYSVESGPFTEKRFTKLPKQEWTLLVQDVEKHLPDFAQYLDLFDFIPRWRIDDLMISVAAEGGGVGPHVDAYDVFLLQAKGRRRWRIAERFNPEIIPEMDLRVLKHFDAEQEWILEPGDMLYLPPNVAHDGVALDDDCMTWSIGFRAPSLRDMFSDFSEWLYQRLPEEKMYTDPDLAFAEARDGSISSSARTRMRDILRTAISVDDAVLDRWFGQFITEPKPWLQCEPPAATPEFEAFATRFRDGDALLRDSRALLAWSPADDGVLFFENGEARKMSRGMEDLLECVCTKRRIEFAGPQSMNDDAIELLRELHSAGVLHFASDVETEND